MSAGNEIPINADSIVDFLTAMFIDTGTTGDVWFSSLANKHGEEPPKHTWTRDSEKLLPWVTKWNRKNRGMFFCVGTVANRERKKENIRELVCLWADIDRPGLADYTAEEIYAAIARLRLQPTIIVESGHGLHLYWVFPKAIDAQANREEVERLLKLLCEHVAGDPQVCEISRLMRLPGSHNTKFDSKVPVTVRTLGGPRHTLSALKGWLGSAVPLTPILRRRAGAGSVPDGAGAPVSPGGNSFIRYPDEQGYKQPIDVEARLAAMRFKAPYPNGVNATELEVTASLLGRGWKVDDVVNKVFDAVMALPEAAGWDQRFERRKIHNLCLSLIKKNPDIAEKQAEALAAEAQDEPAAAAEAQVVNLGAERAKRAPKPKSDQDKPKPAALPYAVAEGVIMALRDGGEDIMHADGETWLYREGFWRMMSPADEQRLRALIHTRFDQLKHQAKAGELLLAWTRLEQHPELTRQNVQWAGAGVLVCKNGVLDLVNGGFTSHSPDNYARRHIGATFEPGADCPVFKKFLRTLFDGHDEPDKIVQLLQEWGGAALSIPSMMREQRCAMLFKGESRTGKTELARVFARLFGDPIASPSVEEIGEKFGLQDLYGATAWVRDDGINEGDELNPQRFKTIVTGEPVNVALKGRVSTFSHCFDIPVLLTCNTLPRANDMSDAIFNRSLVVPFENVVAVSDVAAARAELLGAALAEHKGKYLGHALFDMEGPGILNMMLLGLAALRQRGFFEIPKVVADALQRFKDDNNPVSAWKRECARPNASIRVDRRDLLRAYNGWEYDLEGERARRRGGKWLFPRLRALMPGLVDKMVKGDRFIQGIELTELGLAAWTNYKDATPKPGGSGALTSDQVNKVDLEVGQDDRSKSRF